MFKFHLVTQTSRVSPKHYLTATSHFCCYYNLLAPKHTATDFPVLVQYVHEISNRRLVGHASHLRHSKSQDPARSAPGMSTLRPPCIAFPPPRADTPTPLFHSYLSNPTHHVLPSRRARTTTDVHHYTATPSVTVSKIISYRLLAMLCYTQPPVPVKVPTSRWWFKDPLSASRAVIFWTHPLSVPSPGFDGSLYS